jgi:hypothetical protein
MKGTNISNKKESNLFNFAPNANHFTNCKLFNVYIYIVNLFLYKNYELKSNSLCAICLENSIHISKLNGCCHTFCTKCIKKWQKFHKICPLCRAPFTKIFVSKANNTQKNIINISEKKINDNNFQASNKLPCSHKLSNISICSICGKLGDVDS